MLQSGQTDFDKLLRLTGDQLRLKITKALAHPKSRLVVSYGGALHNDLHPDGESAPYSFAPAVSAQVGGALVELDLYVPEYIGKGCVVRAGCEEEGADTGRAQPRFVCFAVPAKEVTADCAGTGGGSGGGGQGRRRRRWIRGGEIGVARALRPFIVTQARANPAT